jgi:hypothetical protein
LTSFTAITKLCNVAKRDAGEKIVPLVYPEQDRMGSMPMRRSKQISSDILGGGQKLQVRQSYAYRHEKRK